MKGTLQLIFILITSYAMAQDTIVSQDLPTAGKTYVLSIGTAFTGLDPSETGVNFNWDFSDLGRTSQRIDTSFTTASTNPLLSFFFIDNPLNGNRANHAFRGQDFNLGFTGLTDIFNYYYNTSTVYKQPGFGAVVNSVPVPVAYVPHDVLYKLPLKYDDEDSVAYEFAVDLTSTIGIYYHVSRTRHNKVDGWGTLTTPFGTFSVLRVKSVLVEEDSTFITSLNLGVKLPPVTTNEYKWLGKEFGVPLVQINTNASNVINQILYQDSVRLTGIPVLPELVENVIVFPNPASEKIIVRYTLLQNTEVKISLHTSDGKLVDDLLDAKKYTGLNIEGFDLEKYNLPAGNYFIDIRSSNSVITKQVQIR